MEKLNRKRKKSGVKNIKFDLVIPVYNEFPIIIETIKILVRILSVLPPNIEWSIVVADNGSTDSTSACVLEANFPKVRVLNIPGKGKGKAIRFAALSSNADVFGFIDADLSADPKILVLMIKEIISDSTDIIIGSRFLDTKKVNRNFLRTASSRIFNFLQFIILGINVFDSQCGLKIMNKKATSILSEGFENTWFFDLEFLYMSQDKKLRIKEIPVKWEEFRYADRVSKLNVITDGLRAIVAMFKIRARIRKLKKNGQCIN